MTTKLSPAQEKLLAAARAMKPLVFKDGSVDNEHGILVSGREYYTAAALERKGLGKLRYQGASLGWFHAFPAEEKPWDTTDYDTYFRETEDPRVLEAVFRDTDPSAPDGDAYMPAYYLGYHYGWRNEGMIGDVFAAEEEMDAYLDARGRLGDHDKAARFMNIFYETTVTEHWADRDVRFVMLNTPTFRKEMGMDSLETEPADFIAYITGDVWAVGHLINVGRVLDDEDVDIEDGNWQRETECYGYYGLEYAQGSLQDFEMPALDVLLDIA